MELQEGQVMNQKGTSFYSKLITWRNGRLYGKEHSWSHSAIITKIEGDKVLVHEALSNGFVKSYYDKKMIEDRIREGRYAIGTVKKPLKDVLKYAEKYEGKGYGWFDIISIVIYWIFGTKSKFLTTEAQKLICSEAVSRILYDASDKKVNFETEFEIPYDLIEPMHLWQSKQIDWRHA